MPFLNHAQGLVVGHRKTGITTFKRNIKSIKFKDLFPDYNEICQNITFDLKENNHFYPLLFNSSLDVIIFIYSLHDINEGVYTLYKYIKWYNDNINIPDTIIQNIVFINNKIDLLDNYNDNNVKYYDIECKQFCDNNGFKYYDASFKDNPNEIQNIINDIAKDIIKKQCPISLMNSKKNTGTQNHLGSWLYDILTVVISFADLGTDLWILYQYYINGRIPFFIVGLIIIIIAQLGYCIVFIFQFEYHNGTCGNQLSLFIKVLPISWILAGIIYIYDESEWFRNMLLKKFNLERDTYVRSYTRSNAYNWFREKLSKHIGFILESALEAFPQSILQMIAIVIYKETNVIAIISILLSMISVSTKALIFSKSIDTGIFLWNWLCACAVKLYIYIYLLILMCLI